MSELDEIERQLSAATHSSQYRAPVAKLIGQVRKLAARVDALEREDPKVYIAELHRRVAQAATTEELEALVQEIEASERSEDIDEDLVRAVNQRYLLFKQVQEPESPVATEKVADFAGLKKPELQAQARLRGVPTGGTVEELLGRLVAYDDPSNRVDSE